MAITDTVPEITYVIGASSTGPFPVPFKFVADEDLAVYLFDTGETPQLADLLTVGADFTVTGEGEDDGGTLTLSTAAASQSLQITRNTLIERATDFPASGPLSIPALNREFDRQVAIDQELRRDVDDAVEGNDVLRALILSSVPADGDYNYGTPNAVTRTAVLRLRDRVNFADFGVASGSVTGQSALINDAIADVASAGGGRIDLGPGTFYLDSIGGSLAMIMQSGVHVHGAGPGITILKVLDGANSHAINCLNITDFSINDLTVDGNRTNQSSNVHGIRMFGTLANARVNNVEVKSTRHYGIGVEVSEVIGLWMNNLYVHDIGADGIDFKNDSDTNDAVFLNNIYIKNWDQKLEGDQAGIDLRAPAHLTNIFVEGSSAGGAGIRWRFGELLDVNGLGAHESSLTNFRIIGSGLDATAQGLNIGARYVHVGKGIVKSTGIGVRVFGTKTKLEGVDVVSCLDDGFSIDIVTTAPTLPDLPVTYTADDVSLSDCTAESCGGNGLTLDVVDRTSIRGCRFNNNTGYGVFIASGALDTSIKDCFFASNTAGAVNDAAAAGQTHARGNVGWATRSNVQSATFAIDSTGQKTVTVTHGLAVTPTIAQVRGWNMEMVTAVTDHRFGYVMVDGANSTTITFRINVTTASGTGGAVAKICANIDARP